MHKLKCRNDKVLLLHCPGVGGGGVLGISSDWDDRMEPKVKTQKSLGLPAKPKESLDQKLTPKNPMPILWPLKVPERGNAITQRKTLEIEHSCLFIHHTI